MKNYTNWLINNNSARKDLFDSWATRMGVLSILTAAYVNLQSLEEIRGSLIIPITVISISCAVPILIWAAKFSQIIKNEGLLKLSIIFFFDAFCLLAMSTATIIITLYLNQELLAKVITNLSNIFGRASYYAPLIANISIVVIIVIFLIYFIIKEVFNFIKIFIDYISSKK